MMLIPMDLKTLILEHFWESDFVMTSPHQLQISGQIYSNFFILPIFWYRFCRVFPMTLQQIPDILSTKSINFVYSPKLSLLGIESGDFCWVRDLQLTWGGKTPEMIIFWIYPTTRMPVTMKVYRDVSGLLSHFAYIPWANPSQFHSQFYEDLSWDSQA